MDSNGSRSLRYSDFAGAEKKLTELSVRHGMIIDSAGTEAWYHVDLLHRKGAPAVIYPRGGTEWYEHGKLHRIDGPAVAYPDGSKEWFYRGKLHRLNGPAIMNTFLNKHEWWVNDIHISSWDHYQKESDCSVEEVLILKLKWGEISYRDAP